MSGKIWRDVRSHAVVSAALAVVIVFGSAFSRDCAAAQLQQAEVTRIINEVQLLPEQAQPRAAAIKDMINKGTAVRTGVDSRTELMFSDQTLARMGANTIFSFKEGTRELNLGSGVMLVHVPKDAGGAKIVTAAVSAGVTGTTLMFEYHKDAYSKLIVLEGLVKAWLNAHPEIVVEVHGGEMLVIPPHPTSLDQPVNVDLEKLMLTSLLFTDFAPLPSLSLIADVILSQQEYLYVQREDDLTGLDSRSVLFPLLPENAGGGPTGSVITFLGLPAGLWSQKGSWTPAIVPNNVGGKTYTAIINSGMITQDIVAGVIIQQLQMNGGTLQLDHTLTLNTGLQYTGGSIIDGMLSIAGSSTQSVPMDVQGLVIGNSGNYDLTFDSANAFTNNPGSSVFNNTGALRKLNSQDVIDFNMPFNNLGSVTVGGVSGGLIFSAGGNNTGTLSTGTNTVISFDSNFSMLNGTRFVGQGAITFGNGTVTTLSGTISNGTTVFMNSAATFTDFKLNGDVNLTGGGLINVTGADRFLGSGILTTNNTIQGETAGGGSIGANQIGINLQGGTIEANKAGVVLDVDPNSTNGLFNKGFLRASNGGILQLNGNGGGAFNNQNGSISALTGSEVHFVNGATITGGTMGTTGTGVIRNLNTATLNSLSNTGTFSGDDGSVTTLSGTINNTGRLTLNSTATNTDFLLNGDVSLTGHGNVVLSSHARILGNGTFTNTDNVIQGETSGGTSIGSDQIGIINRVGGVISANVNTLKLTIDPNSSAGLLNEGTMEAVNGGILVLSGNGGGGFNNAGSMTVGTGSQLLTDGAVMSSGIVDIGDGDFTINSGGSYTQTAGTFKIANGSVSSAAALDFQGGTIDAFGGISAPIKVGAANLKVALGGSGLNVTGNVTLMNSSSLSFQLGGLTSGSQYSALNVNGTVALSGNLVLSFANGFQNSVANGDTFTITSATTINGAFANVASGGTLQTSDGFGSFTVTISGTNITLSGFTASPIPPIAAMWTGTTGNWTDPTNWSINPNFPNNGQPGGTEFYDATLNNGGTITLDAPITIQKFTFTGGTLTGNNTLTLNDLFTWGNSASVANGPTINANGGILFSGNPANLDASTIHLASGQTATMNAASARFIFTSNGIFNNDGTFLAQNDQGLSGSGTFNNSGQFQRDTSGNTFTIGNGIGFVNNANVTAQSGTLKFSGSVTNNLLMTASNGATLQIDGLLSSGATAKVDLENGTLLVNGAADTNQVVGASGTITVNAGGNFSAVGDLEFNGTHTSTGNGGSLNLTAPSVSFGSAIGQINGADFDGKDSAIIGQPGGDGGTLHVTATSGDITASNAQILASTGQNGPSVTLGGTGGTVIFDAPNGSITVQNKIQVSDNGGNRVSAKGGAITLTSGKAGNGALAINVVNSGQLLSLLNAAVPLANGGQIKFVASGAGSKINIQGQGAVQPTIEADRGLVDIRQNNSGFVNIGDVTPVLIHGDTVKIAALGTNGQLTIGNATIDADSLLQLYADAADATGKVTFVGNAILSGAGSKIIAAGTVKINSGVQVTVNGGQAQVFTNNPLYSSAGGTDPTGGIFTGAGAPTTVSPLGGQPSLGAQPVASHPGRH